MSVGHTDPHLDDDRLCQCACPACVSEWRSLRFGGQRRYCVCPDCSGGDCPPWRLDPELAGFIARAGTEASNG